MLDPTVGSVAERSAVPLTDHRRCWHTRSGGDRGRPELEGRRRGAYAYAEQTEARTWYAQGAVL